MTRDDQLIFDVGLHKGEDTEFYLKKGYRVVAFEANPNLVSLCRGRFSEELRSGQLHIIDGAIAPPADVDRVDFYVNEKSVWGSTDLDWVNRNKSWGFESEKVEVNRVDMAQVLRYFRIPFYLKIDIEGADGLVLNALHRFVQKPQYVSIEANIVTPNQLEMDLETLNSLGYKKFQIVQQQNIPGSQIITDTLRGDKIEHIFSEDASGAFGADLPNEWVNRDAILGLFSRPLPGWYDIHASL